MSLGAGIRQTVFSGIVVARIGSHLILMVEVVFMIFWFNLNSLQR